MSSSSSDMGASPVTGCAGGTFLNYLIPLRLSALRFCDIVLASGDLCLPMFYFRSSLGHVVVPCQNRCRSQGAGRLSNDAGRFERHSREAEDDGWDPDPDLPPLRTEVAEERPRTAITRNTSPDLSFDRSINPYRGCEHGCIYCFARPSHAYLGLSPGLDFETRLIARPDIARVLEAELRKPRYRPAPIAIGTNTDPYQPVEAERRIMRAVLEVLQAFRHPVTVTTKGTLIERDADILGEMGQAGLAQVGISVTTLDAELARGWNRAVPRPRGG
jgi:hypothetical protein